MNETKRKSIGKTCRKSHKKFFFQNEKSTQHHSSQIEIRREQNKKQETFFIKKEKIRKCIKIFFVIYSKQNGKH